jgi:uncharacterized protein YraI
MNRTITIVAAGFLAAISMTASAQSAYTTRSVNVRSGPDTSYPPVAVLATGAPVQVMGCLDDWSWCDVVFGDNRGWTYAPYLNYDYQGARVPFYSYAPAFGIPIVTFALGSYWDHYYRGRDFYGRRDYWGGRTYAHVRPPGPAPVRVIPPSYRTGHIDAHTSHDVNVNRNVNVNRDVNVNKNVNVNQNVNVNKNVNASHDVNASRDHKGTPVANTGKPPPTVGHPQDMKRASPTAQAAAVPHGAPQGQPHGAPQGAPQGHPQGNTSHGNEHQGGKEEKH